MLTLCHFNDAYLPKFAPSWCTFVKTKVPDAVVTCGGDVFNPSMISTVTRGKHVPPLLNALDVSVSCLGNHDLDFGLPSFVKLSRECKFPWVCSNLPIEGCLESTIIERNGVKIGFFGVVGGDFVSCLNFDTKGLVAEDQVACAERMVAKLESQCDTIVCLSHCRMHDDRRIAALCKPNSKFQLVLGAHDHELLSEAPYLYKAGCDWNWIVIASFSKEKNAWTVTTDTISEKENPANAEVAKVLAAWESQMQAGLSKVLAVLPHDLDCRTSLIRRQESPVGNWICDMVKHQFAVILNRPVDIVLINCGSFRGDKILQAGNFTVESLLGLLPFNDLTLAYTISGAKLIEALAAGTSKFPAENGGFPAVSSGVRVHIKEKKVVSFQIDGVDVDEKKEYVFVTKSFLADGKDGYDCIAGHCKPLMDPEFALLLSSLVRRSIILANALLKFGPKKDISSRFIDKLRRQDSHYYKIRAEVEGRIVIE